MVELDDSLSTVKSIPTPTVESNINFNSIIQLYGEYAESRLSERVNHGILSSDSELRARRGNKGILSKAG